MDSVLKMREFFASHWKIDETGLYADNIKTGERILLERFVDEARRGIKMVNKYGSVLKI